ncbi:hypothetical protein QNI16_20760 [Cytophagaceae bacterium YF14B1]|uniref:Lipoprotein n=1 Tax=Xanthocytophaga flava TaxID=3048013 RepID=A0AAE3QQC1_9BACT|nr:hypothetical protein [Xanthocytophaga flavus]MDJ1482946.1 hypothetical protein [Xanthocytophaga flavus]
MRHLSLFSFLIINILLATHCTSETESKQTSTQAVVTPSLKSKPLLKDYITKIPLIKTPVTFNSNTFENMTPRDEKLAQLFSSPDNNTLVGRLFSTDEFDALLFSVPADGTLPMVITYDKAGNKIDSLGLIEMGGSDVGFDCIEHVTVNPDRTMLLIDSTTRWQVTADNAAPIEGSDTLIVTQKVFELLDNGRFKKSIKK